MTSGICFRFPWARNRNGKYYFEEDAEGCCTTCYGGIRTAPLTPLAHLCRSRPRLPLKCSPGSDAADPLKRRLEEKRQWRLLSVRLAWNSLFPSWPLGNEIILFLTFLLYHKTLLPIPSPDLLEFSALHTLSIAQSICGAHSSSPPLILTRNYAVLASFQALTRGLNLRAFTDVQTFASAYTTFPVSRQVLYVVGILFEEGPQDLPELQKSLHLPGHCEKGTTGTPARWP